MSDDATPAPSYVVRTVVRLLVPFVALFGLFVAFHGADSAGGGFQGGVVVGTSIVLVALVFDVERLRPSLDRPGLALITLSGIAVFAIVGLGTIVLGGAFLQYDVVAIPKATVYGIELVELGIAGTVTGVVVLLFFGLTASQTGTGQDGDIPIESNPDTEDDPPEVTERE